MGWLTGFDGYWGEFTGKTASSLAIIQEGFYLYLKVFLVIKLVKITLQKVLILNLTNYFPNKQLDDTHFYYCYAHESNKTRS